MITVTIQIGNSDDKLTQKEWSSFIECIRCEIARLATEIHFNGYSEGSRAWQNAAFVFTIELKNMDALKEEITAVRKMFKQDSVAWTDGITQFI